MATGVSCSIIFILIGFLTQSLALENSCSRVFRTENQTYLVQDKVYCDFGNRVLSCLSKKGWDIRIPSVSDEDHQIPVPGSHHCLLELFVGQEYGESIYLVDNNCSHADLEGRLARALADTLVSHNVLELQECAHNVNKELKKETDEFWVLLLPMWLAFFCAMIVIIKFSIWCVIRSREKSPYPNLLESNEGLESD